MKRLDLCYLHPKLEVRHAGIEPGPPPVWRIPDPTFFHPGSELSPSRIPDPHQRI
jgi:hypothetical protein